MKLIHILFRTRLQTKSFSYDAKINATTRLLPKILYYIQLLQYIIIYYVPTCAFTIFDKQLKF